MVTLGNRGIKLEESQRWPIGYVILSSLHANILT